ncbi:hypothetical protein BHE74_00000943 [Ensete ventricosum]|nr:hypothetical protein BHE74_00000943 [Ensete ventricosum]
MELELGRMSGDPELDLGGRLLEWWSSGREEILQLGSTADSCTKAGSGLSRIVKKEQIGASQLEGGDFEYKPRSGAGLFL